MKENFKNYLVEFIGTFFLVLTIACCSYNNQRFAPFAIAAVLTVMIYAGGHISGAHYNPAVSLAALIRGALNQKLVVPYMVSQFLGGICAVIVFYILAGRTNIFTIANYNIAALLIAETLFTFALCYVVLLCATTKETQGNSYFGFAIGFTVLAAALAVGGKFCAGAFNPAVAISLGIMKSASWALAIYTIIANFTGAILAAFAYKTIYKTEEENQ